MKIFRDDFSYVKDSVCKKLFSVPQAVYETLQGSSNRSEPGVWSKDSLVRWQKIFFLIL